jgi:hypothetical protein
MMQVKVSSERGRKQAQWSPVHFSRQVICNTDWISAHDIAWAPRRWSPHLSALTDVRSGAGGLCLSRSAGKAAAAAAARQAAGASAGMAVTVPAAGKVAAAPAAAGAAAPVAAQATAAAAVMSCTAKMRPCGACLGFRDGAPAERCANGKKEGRAAAHASGCGTWAWRSGRAPGSGSWAIEHNRLVGPQSCSTMFLLEYSIVVYAL